MVHLQHCTNGLQGACRKTYAPAATQPVFSRLLCKVTRCCTGGGRDQVLAEFGEVADASRRLQLLTEIHGVDSDTARLLDVPCAQVSIGEDHGREEVASYVAAAHGVLGMGYRLVGPVDVSEAGGGFCRHRLIEVADPLRLVLSSQTVQQQSFRPLPGP
ncbi:hypothetical protein ACIHAR_12700 [Streptomyces sp. NPDC052016]|uniref:hypothetical protein n=1 Tax=Streptomyces sp. NPDC052016 TaxID=3365680 RepID=UPI0037D2FC56